MLESLLVALREGVEAALVVAIVLAYLRKTNRLPLAKWVFWGLALAVLASIGGAVVFSHYEVDEEFFEGAVFMASALLCGTMLVWMAYTAKGLKKEIESKVESIAGATTKAGLGLLLFTFLMVFREGVEMVLLLGAVQLNTEAMKAFTGTVVGLLLAVAFGVAFVKGTVRIDLAKFFRATTAVLAVLVVQLLVNGLHEWSEAGIIPSNERLMSIVGPIVRNNAFFLLAVVLVPGIMLWSELRRRIPEPEPSADNPAERRKTLAAAMSQRRWSLAASSSAVALLLLLCVGIVHSNQPRSLSPAAPVQAEGGVVRLPLAGNDDGDLHRYSLDIDGIPVRFFAIKTSDGKLRTAVDACDICGAYGYVQEGTQVICLNCTAEINPLSIGRDGGCNPIPLPAEVKDGVIAIPVVGLQKQKGKFGKPASATAVDPVCLMNIDPANARGTAEHGGKTFYFCNEECRKAFLADSARFAK